jgi:molecular chaperone IbpA|tara:strand:+ start:5345 stop:5761 length:417 start_codon:yes stop_codon:yes gene_type:complete
MKLSPKNILKFYVGYDDFFNDLENQTANTSISNIAFDVLKHGDNQYEIHVALAGINENQISLIQFDDFLKLEVEAPEFNFHENIIHKGIRNKSFKQSFRLEQNIEVDEAIIKNGILIIKLYKREPVKKLKKRIEITEM